MADERHDAETKKAARDDGEAAAHEGEASDRAEREKSEGPRPSETTAAGFRDRVRDLAGVGLLSLGKFIAAGDDEAEEQQQEPDQRRRGRTCVGRGVKVVVDVR